MEIIEQKAAKLFKQHKASGKRGHGIKSATRALLQESGKTFDSLEHYLRNYYNSGNWNNGVKEVCKNFKKEIATEDTEYNTSLEKRLSLSENALKRAKFENKYQHNLIRESFIEAMKVMPIQVSEYKKWHLPTKAKSERANFGLVSDTHFGTIIDEREVDRNRYNWQIAARRLGFYTETLASFKYDHRNECPTLYLNLAGDLCAGIINCDDDNIELLTTQLLGASRMFVSMIDYLLNFYSDIKIPSCPDNHLRILTHTKGKNRATAQKWDSYSTILMESLQMAFRHNPRVEFIIPMTPYTKYKVFDRVVYVTHGDTVLGFGNPGTSINVKQISASIDRINAGLPTDEKIEIVLSGHVHTGLYIALENDVDLLVNPSLIGLDPYAQSIGLPNSRTGQWLFESTREYRVGDMRMVDTYRADTNSEYEKIIPAYDYSLVSRKY